MLMYHQIVHTVSKLLQCNRDSISLQLMKRFKNMHNQKVYGEKMKVDVIYEKGVFKIVSPVEIDTDEITVHIINRDEILTETDMRDIVDAVSAREEGDCYTYEDVFE